jgi:formamidopyrimidine-DNA glycosylase
MINMPEGPEILYLSKICGKHLIGHNLTNIISNTKHRIYLPKISKLKFIKTYGKLMVFIFEDFYFHIHLGLTGWVTFKDPSYPRYELIFDNLTMYIDDSRKFSKLKIYKENKDSEKVIKKLGIDILTPQFTLDFFKDYIKQKNKNIATLLLEQNKVCGIGNYIKNESLYEARISPYRNSNELDDSEINKLYKSILHVSYSNYIEMMKMNKLPIDKMYKQIKTTVPYKFKVYGNDHDPLGNKISKDEVGGRKTFYVKSLQK